MKIIDVNVSIGPSTKPIRYRDAEGLIHYLDDYCLSSAVVYHSAAQMTPWLYNEEMSCIASGSNGRIRACHFLDPMLTERSLPGEGSLEHRLRKSQPEAVRMMPKTQNYPLSTFFCDRILGVLDQLRLPLLLDASEMTSLADLPTLVRDFPHLPIVILRHYFNTSRTMTPLLTKLDNVYFDVNIIIDTGYLEELVNNYCCSEKLMLGSGLPHHVPAGGLALVLYSTIADVHKQNILHANWERLQGGIGYDHQG